MEGFDLEGTLIILNGSNPEYDSDFEVYSSKITSMNETITSVNDCTEPTNFHSLKFKRKTVHYLPKGIDKFFPNLERLAVYGSELKSLSQNDLKSLTQLKLVDFSMNDLEFLDDDLFEFNQKLRYVNFKENKLKYVGENLLNNLKNLKQIDFNSNLCTKNEAIVVYEIPALFQKLKTLCKFPPYVFLLREQWNEKMADLKTKSNQTAIELISKNSEINTLKADSTRQANSLKACEIQNGKNEELIRILYATIGEMKFKPDLQMKVFATLQDQFAKLKRWLKSCDGNLNAATGILLRTSDHQQVFTQASSEMCDLIVEVDGSKVTVSELVISSPGSIIGSVKYANGSSVDNKATELYIDHQQTLFLLTNLGQRFPALQVLAVTSSGLMQIDSSVFLFMKNLKVLNLASNKLQDMQPGTFDQLKLLESLDLSSNNLKTLTTRAFTELGKLQILNLAGNRLKAISSNLFEPLKVLKSVNLSNNDCISLSFPEVTFKEVKNQIINGCIAPVEIECLMRGTDCNAVNLTIVQPKTKISKFKNQIGFESFTFSISDQRVSFLPFQLGKVFTNLRVLVVSRSQLTALNERDFEGLTKMKSITIVHNNISLIEFGVFDDVPQLEHLDLSSNNILTLPAIIFVKLAQLKTLNLSDNRLQSFLSQFLPSKNVIEEFLIKDNAIVRSDLDTSINSKKVKIIDLTNNFCINFKYKSGITFNELFKALRNCSIQCKFDKHHHHHHHQVEVDSIYDYLEATDLF